MPKETLKIEVTFTERVLGSLPGSKEVTSIYIADKAPTPESKAEEVEAIPVFVDELEKGTTVFARSKEGKSLILWDYQFKGFIKESLSVLIDLGECKISKWAYKRVVDSCVFVVPREIPFLRNGKPITAPDGFCERPLMCDTQQGKRVALARSEQVNEGCTALIELNILTSSNPKSGFSLIKPDLIKQCLDYGALKGVGQWRNSGCGKFTYRVL